MTVANTSPPTISDTTPQRGQTLTVNPGTWTHDLDSIRYEYQWQRCDALGANCADIGSATQPSYVVSTADVDSTLRVRVHAIEYSTPEPPAGSGYFMDGFDTGLFAFPPWLGIHSYESTPPAGWTGLKPADGGAPVSQDSTGRVSIVADPAGGPDTVARFEIRDSDPNWPPDTSLDKSEVRAGVAETWDKSQLAVGDIRNFTLDLYLPNDFDWPQSGFFTLAGLHPGINRWGCVDIRMESFSNPVYITFRIDGGPTTGSTQIAVNALQLTDGAGARISGNFNRWVNIEWSVRFAPDNTGWISIDVDGSPVLAQTFRPTMWTNDYSQYHKIGLYKRSVTPFPSGKSVVYMRNCTIDV